MHIYQECCLTCGHVALGAGGAGMAGEFKKVSSGMKLWIGDMTKKRQTTAVCALQTTVYYLFKDEVSTPDDILTKTDVNN